MKIIISDVEEGAVDVSFERSIADTEGATFPEVYSRIMAALEGATRQFLKEVPVSDKKTFREHLYDLLDDGFGNFLKKVFPEIDVGKFTLSAAAIVYAEDQIIQKAEAEGKTYEEMLEEYEAIADKYIAEKRLN